MKKRDPFREFIEGLSDLDNLDKDSIAKKVDEALAAWIVEYYPNGFKFDYKRRDLMIAVLKKTEELINLISESAFRPYLEVLIFMKWDEFRKDLEGKQARGEIIDPSAAAMEIYINVLILGYALKSLEDKEKKKKNDSS